MAKELLAAQTGAGNSISFKVLDESRPVTVQAHGLAGGETGTVQKYIASGYRNLYDESGSLVQLTSTRNAIRVLGEGQYRVSKSITAGAVGIELEGKFQAGDDA